jgi:hypothetical protein
LWKVPHETFPALRARVDAGPRGERRAILRLRLLPAEGDRLCAALGEVPDDAVVAIVPGLDAEADSLLTWVPGQKGLEAIGPDGSPGRRTGLCFVALARSAPRDEWKETEDGVALLLTAAGWARLRQALLDHAPLDLRMEDGRSLALSWTMGGYVSPIDGQVFGVGGDWSCYRRGEPTDGGDALPAEPPEPGPGGSMDVVLLTPTSLLVQRTTEADLGAYLQRVEAVIRRQIGRDPAVRLHVRIVLEPRQRVSVSTACEPRDLDERVSEAVGCLTPVPEVTGEVALELVCPGRSRPA